MMTVFVAMLCGSLMLVIGFEVDDGEAKTAKADALVEAAEAARAASQDIDIPVLRRDRVIVLDEAAARQTVAQYMAATGDHATIDIGQKPNGAPDARRPRAFAAEVTVTVTRTVPSQFLWAIGLDSFAETASATVSPEPGRAP